MKCGHCKETEGVTVAHVRSCAGNAPKPPVAVSAPVKPVVKTLAEEPVAGIYVLPNGGNMYKVQQSPKSGQFYAKVWDRELQEWEYVGKKPLYSLTAEHRMTAAQAKQWGDIYGNCVFCGRTLTDERSIDAGYGPVCAEHNDLPWGE